MIEPGGLFDVPWVWSNLFSGVTIHDLLTLCENVVIPATQRKEVSFRGVFV